MKCQKNVNVKGGHYIAMKSGGKTLMGTCPECGGHVIKFGTGNKKSERPDA